MVNIWGSSKSISLFKEKVASSFRPNHLQVVAAATGFYKRSSKLLPAKFFEIMLYAASFNSNCSLLQASNEIAESFGVSISKQGLDDRIDDTAVAFMKSIFEEQLVRQIDGTIHPDYFKNFSRVRIKDSTRFDLPTRLKKQFTGYGGKVSSEAGASIQYEFDVKSGKILDVDFTSATRTDYQDAKEKADDIQKGDLVIRDLGYFKTGLLRYYQDKQASFISRLNSNILVYQQNGEEVSFSKLYKRMIRYKIPHMELNVLIGLKEKFPTRLIIDVMPEDVYQTRIEKAEKTAKKKRRQVSDEHKARTHFNLLITNISAEDLPSNQVYQIYKIRWQIELIFKIWKSTCGINKIHPMRYHRLMCLFYAKFILIILNFQIIHLLQRQLYPQFGKLLSKDKCFKTLTTYFYKIRNALFSPNQKIALLIQAFSSLLSKNHWLEKRVKRLNYVDIFHIYIS